MQYLRLMAFVVFSLATINVTQARIFEIKATAGLGMPAGDMDAALVQAWRFKVNLNFPVQPVLLQQSYLASRFSAGSSGKIFVNVESGYLLAEYNFPLPSRIVSPYIAAGGGIHMMNSLSTANSTLGSQGVSVFTSKAHLFFGVDFSLSRRWSIQAEGRMTYPSDFVIDLYSVSLGLKI